MRKNSLFANVQVLPTITKNGEYKARVSKINLSKGVQYINMSPFEDSVEAIRRNFEPGVSQEREPDFKLVLDIQKIIAKNKGANYERWAKRFNLKQTAKALCFIQEHGMLMLTQKQNV